jgi:C4-type Zn-finger protein
MRPYMEIYYNDLGHRVTQIEIPSERYPSHVLVDTDLARLLKLSFLSSIALPMAEDEIDDDDMEEALTTRISNVLRQYSPERSFFEAVANAVDAGATRVSILLDETSHAEVGDFLTQEMADFQGRSLVIHNDAVFQEKDWKGIRRIGQGGKQGSDTIGRFGLGALSMFHFTEVR